MEEKQPPAYIAMLAATIVLSLLAIITLLPSPGASKPNVLGYRSVCSFAPAASALCGLVAGICCTIRRRRFSRTASSARYAPLFVPVGVSLILLVIAGIFTVRFVRVQSRFVAVIEKTQGEGGALGVLKDGVYKASASEGDISAVVELRVAAGRVDDIRLIEGKNVETSLAAQLFEQVVASQSSAVDGVSGATASSHVLLNAIAAAAAVGR